MNADRRTPSFDFAALLVAHHRTGMPTAANPLDAVTNAVHSVSLEVTRWVGPDGCHALLTRALNRARDNHGAVREVRIVKNSAPALEGLDTCIEANGADAVALGLNTMLTELFDLLGRVIGDDLTARIVEQITRKSATDV